MFEKIYSIGFFAVVIVLGLCVWIAKERGAEDIPQKTDGVNYLTLKILRLVP